MSTKKKRFVLLDRDGTLIVERHHLSLPEQVELLPGVASALGRMQQMGLGLVMVTNQSVIARGMVEERDLERIHERVTKPLKAEGVDLDGIYYCPHRSEDECHCRKPNPGMVERAAKELAFDPKDSFVIGDKACDIDLGRSFGATTVLVRTGYGTRTADNPAVQPSFVVANLAEAADVIEAQLAEQRECDA